jgi:hypothetical protein
MVIFKGEGRRNVTNLLNLCPPFGNIIFSFSFYLTFSLSNIIFIQEEILEDQINRDRSIRKIYYMLLTKRILDVIDTKK